LSRSVKMWSDRVFRDLLSGQPSGPSTFLPARVLSVPLRTPPLDRFIGSPSGTPSPDPLSRTISPGRRLGPAIGPRVLQRYLRVPPDPHRVTSPDITLVPDPQPRSRLSCFPTIRSDHQFPFSSSRITPSDPRRARPLSVYPDRRFRPPPSRNPLLPCRNPPSPSRRVLFRFPPPDHHLLLQYSTVNSPLPPVKMDNHGNSSRHCANEAHTSW
jgi:hypothetical protein